MFFAQAYDFEGENAMTVLHTTEEGAVTNLFTIKTHEGTVVADRVKIADSFTARLRGLMFRRNLEEGEGLIISPCTSIHMMFMRFPIDAIFTDSQNRIIAVYSNLRPWLGFSGWHGNAEKVIELPAGTAGKFGIKTGQILSVITTQEIHSRKEI